VDILEEGGNVQNLTGSGANPEGGEVTELLRRWRAGDLSAEPLLFELVQPELHRLAEYYMRHERAGHTLQPTALLNETYLRLTGAREADWRDRHHFYALAARAMRRFLIDYARNRGAGIRLPLDEIAPFLAADSKNLDLAIAIDAILEELAKENREGASMVELKYFLGLSDEDAAEALNLPVRTAQRRWVEARKWLFEQLENQGWNITRKATTSGS
jgi:RNA polymerase sigma factor (TIGR02999 family)